MTLGMRLCGAGALALMTGAGLTLPVQASSRPAPRVATSPAAKRPAPLQRPQIFEVNPTRVSRSHASNIMLVGQNLTPATRVLIGTHPATTVEADGFHLLASVPDDLSTGTYPIAVENDGGAATADSQLVVEPDSSLDKTTMLIGGGFLALMALVMRLARSPIPTA
jgi:hypothetical protein